MKTSASSPWRRFLSWLVKLDSIHLLILGYSSYIVVGWLVLCLPFAHQNGSGTWLDHLFTSTSAVSTTGLVTISTSDAYNWFGEFTVMMLIQFGGLGYMTISSFVVLAVSGGLSPMRERMGTTALSLPDGFQVRDFLKIIVVFTFMIEAAGAVALVPVFRAHGAPSPVWQSIFHSVSAFCTAGFGLFNDSFESYRGDVWLNVVISALSYLGAIGFIVINDVWKTIRHRKPHLTLTSKVIMLSTCWVSLVGTVLFFVDEPTVQALPVGERWMTSLFQVMTASTTVGFDTIPIGKLGASSTFLLTIVMIIGASPSGTGGGLKTTTLTAVWAEMMSVLRRRDKTTFLGRVIPEIRMRAAVANLLFYLLALAAGIYCLALVESAPLADQMFECASALGTVGLSRGITGSLTPIGKGIIIALMFVGRLGPVVLGMAFFKTPEARSQTFGKREMSEDVAI